MAKKAFKINLIPALKKLEIATKALATTHIIGSYKSSFRGKGLEFDSYRHYNPDDDATLIDWKASARSGEILVKQFIEERNINVFILVDISSSMLYGSSASKLKIIYAVELAASLCYAILKAQDRVGYGLVSDGLIKYSTLDNTPNQFYNFSKDILNPNYYGGPFNLPAALDSISTFIPDRTVVIIISDFLGLPAGWENTFATTARKFDIVGIMIRDLFDKTLPATDTNLLVENPYGEEQLLINPAVLKHTFENKAREQEAHLKTIFVKNKADLLTLTTDQSFVRPLVAFFKRREQRRR